MIWTSDPHRYALMTDISEHQRGADIAAHAAAGYGIISLRTQFGGRFIDRQFDNFAPAARDAGLKRLYYVWVLPTDSADSHIALMREAEARHGKPELGWMLDVEDTQNVTGDKAAYRSLLLKLAAECVRMSGKLPVIYTAGWYWDNHLGGVEDFGDCPLIVASYPFQRQDGTESKPHPADVRQYGSWAFANATAADRSVPRTGGWDTWQGWQFTSLAGLNIPGFAQRGVRGLDMNLLRPEWVAQRTGQPNPGQSAGGGRDPEPFPDTDPLENAMPARYLRSDGAQFILGPNGNDCIPISPAYSDLLALGGSALLGPSADVDAKLAELLTGGSPRDVGGFLSGKVDESTAAILAKPTTAGPAGPTAAQIADELARRLGS